jgi:2,4-dienoyl-CoA reductase-like NADH-dependent reductase (Old Yellow Enzyme family)
MATATDAMERQALEGDGLEVLWQPLSIGSREIANRIMVSAHGTLHDPDRYVAYLGARARGGAGLIVTQAISVHVSGNVTDVLPVPLGWLPETVVLYGRYAAAVHEHGGIIFGQLHHTGHQDLGTMSLEQWHAVVAPTSLPSPVYGTQAKALTEPEIAEIVAAFGEAAGLMQQGGLDGCEVHAGHGYLLHEFLSPLTNRRTDRYGGSPENRARIVIAVGRAVRARCGPRFPIGLKLSFQEFVGEAGLTPAVASENLRVIHAEGLFDYVSISGAAYHALEQLVATMESGQSGHLAQDAFAAKQVVGDLPVMVTGAVSTLQRAAEIVRAGQADAVGMVRAHIADPDLVRKAQQGRVAEIRPCVGANQSCWRRVFRGGQLTCTVNPEAGREGRWGDAFFAPVAQPRRVVVLGGGPAGLKAAESAARRGHDVTLLEREPELGGQLRFAGRLPGRDRWLRLVDHLAGSIDRLGVDVRLDTVATPEAVKLLSPDAVVVATGASWERSGFSMLRPDRDGIPGADTGNVADPVQAIAAPERCGGRVLIVDDHGTHLALGLAQLLTADNRSVEFVTAHSQPGIQTGVLGTVDFPWIYPRLVAAGVRFSVEATVVEIDGGTVRIAHVYGGWSREVENVDTVVLCMGRRPEDGLYSALQGERFVVERIGDCAAPREVDDAILEGARSAIAIPVGAATGATA